MKEFISHILKQVAAILEYVIAFMLAIGIILLCFRMVCSLQNIPHLNTYPNYDDLLEVCFNLIIGVELIRMMYSHSPSTVFEVLLFAIARHIIMDHSSIYSSLIGVCSIAVLFATRKYLFSEFDVADETVFRASTKAKVVNKILSVNIPHKTDDTLAVRLFVEHISVICLLYNMFFKKECFAQEQEYRMVFLCVHRRKQLLSGDSILVEYRIKDEVFIPFIRMKLGDISCLKSVCVGTKNTSDLAVKGLRHYFGSRNLEVRVKKSEIPLRY